MKSSFRGAKRRGNPFSPHDRKCGAGGYGLPHRRARRFAMTFFESAAGVGGASGKSAKRRRWRKKRAGFEEVPRLAATTVDGNRLARRWAIAAPYGSMVRNAAQAGGVEPRPYAGQDDFRKNVIPRSEATWESVFPVWQGCGVGVLRIATPACGLVRNDRFFWECGAYRAAGRRGRRPLRKHCRECRALSGGGVRAPRPTEGKRIFV